MEYGRVRVANFVPEARTAIARCNIGLLDRQIHPDDIASTLNVTAIDPLNDGVDRTVQWVPYGPLYASGYCRNITVTFKVALAAGVALASRSDDLDHPYFGGNFSVAGTDREIVISDAASTPGTMTIHPDVLAHMANARFILKVPLIANGAATGTAVTYACSMNLLSGGFGEYYNRSNDQLYTGHESIYLPAGVFEADTRGAGQCYHSAVASRFYPEYQGSTKEAVNSFWQKAYTRIPSNERYVDVWWSFGNSFVTRDNNDASVTWPLSGPRCLTGTQYFSGDITLTVIGPRVCGMWETGGVKSKTESYNATTEDWTTVFVLVSSTGDLEHARFPHFGIGASFPVLRFSLFFDKGTLTSSDEDNLAALIHSVNGDTWVTANSSWGNVEHAYGPFGSVPARPGNDTIPSNAFINSDATAYTRCGNLSYVGMAHYQDRILTKDPLYGFPASTGASSALAVYWQKAWPWSRTGFPDLRARIRDAYAHCWRSDKHYEEDVVPIDIDNYKNKSQRRNAVPKPTCDIILYGGVPHTDLDGDIQPNANEFVKLGRMFNPRKHAAYAYNGNHVEGWGAMDYQHADYSDLCFADTLTADIGLHYFLIPHLVTNALCSKPHRDGYWTAKASYDLAPTSPTSGWSPANTTTWGYTNTVVLYGIPRDEGRGGWTAPVQAFYCSGDVRIIRKLLLRKETVWMAPEQVGYLGNLYDTSNYERAAHFFKHGVYRTTNIKTHVLGEDFNNNLPGSISYNPMYSFWGMPWFWAFLRALRYLDMSAVDLTDVSDPRTTAKSIADHAEEFSDILYEFCQSFLDHALVRNSATGGRYHMLQCIAWFTDRVGGVDVAGGGQGLPPAIKALPVVPGYSGGPSGLYPINPATGLVWAIIPGYSYIYYSSNALIIGYELAVERADTDYIERFADVLDSTNGRGILFGNTPLLRQGWDFGFNGEHSPVESMAVVPQAMRDRTSLTYMISAHTLDGATTFPVIDLSFDFYLPAITLDGSTEFPDNSITVGEGLVDLGSVNLSGSTSFTWAEPIDPGDVEFPNVDAEATALTGATVFIGAPYGGTTPGTKPADPDVVGGAQPYIEATALASSTNFTRSFLTLINRLDGVGVFNYRIVGSLLEDTYLTANITDGMPAKNQTFELFAGNTNLITVTVSHATPSKVLDLSTFDDIVWVLKSRVDGDDNLIKKSLGAGVSVLNETQFTVELAKEDTQRLRDKYYHECYVTNEDGEQYTLCIGYVYINPTAAEHG